MIEKYMGMLISGGFNLIKMAVIGAIAIILLILLFFIGLIAILGIVLVLAGLYIVILIKQEMKVGLAMIIIGIILAILDLWII